jgi:hypothetical protein
MLDFNRHLIRANFGDDSADLAVIEPDGLAGLHGVEEFWQGDSDPRGTHQLMILIETRGVAGFEGAAQNEQIAGPQ